MSILSDFFTKSIIVASAPNKVRMRTSLRVIVGTAFLEKYTIRINDQGGVVLEGTNPIASIGRLNDLVVDSAHRGQGIGTKLVVAWYMANRDFAPAGNPVRTEAGQKVYTAAWTLIEAALAAEKAPAKP